MVTNLETKNSYTVLDSKANRIYFALEGSKEIPERYLRAGAAAETTPKRSLTSLTVALRPLPARARASRPFTDSDFCARQCLGPIRPLKLHVTDNVGREILTMVRPFSCDTVWCPFILPIHFCWLQTMDMFVTATNTKIGSLAQQYSLIKPHLNVLDGSGTHIMTVMGPVIHCCRCDDIPFTVTSPTGQPMGTIIKKWSGFFLEAFTSANNFEASCTWPQPSPATRRCPLFLTVGARRFFRFS